MYDVFLTREAQRFYEDAAPTLVHKLKGYKMLCSQIPALELLRRFPKLEKPASKKAFEGGVSYAR